VSQALLPSLGLRHCAVIRSIAAGERGVAIELTAGGNAPDFLFGPSKLHTFQLGFYPAPQHGAGGVELRNFALVATGLEDTLLTQASAPERVEQDSSVGTPGLFDPKDCYDASETDPAKIHLATQAWISTAAQYCRDANYYRGLLAKTAALLGEEVCRQDDGGLLSEPLVSKVPEVVAVWAKERGDLKKLVSQLTKLGELHIGARFDSVAALMN
jgi:hypothetical protein